MRVTTKITVAQLKLNPSEHNLPAREKAAFWHDVKVVCCLRTDSLFTHSNEFTRQITILLTDDRQLHQAASNVCLQALPLSPQDFFTLSPNREPVHRQSPNSCQGDMVLCMRKVLAITYSKYTN